MSRRDYVAAASIVRQAQYLNEEQRFELFEDLARWFSSDNPRFDASRFFAACGIADGLSRHAGRRAA